MAAIHRDVHIHSTYSFDGKSPVRAYIDRARELGLREICITDHQDVYKRQRQDRFNQRFTEQIGHSFRPFSSRFRRRIS